MIKDKSIHEIKARMSSESINKIESITHIHEADFENVKPLNLTGLKQEKPHPTEYVIYPILPTQGICIIYAAPGVGKTLFTLNLAYSIGCGGQFTKYTCPQARKVLYVDGEMSFANIHQRILAIEKTQGKMACEDNFQLLTPDKILPSRMPKIDTPAGQRYYTNLLQTGNYNVVFFDNLSMLASLDENKSHEWAIIQDWFLYLRSLGISVVLVHHAGKDKFGFRGTSRMIDCVNTAISLQAIDEDMPNDWNIDCKRIKVAYHKNRDFGGKDALPFEINLQNDQWRFQAIELTDMEKVIESTKAGMSQREIAKEMNCSQKKVFTLLNKAKTQGRFLV